MLADYTALFKRGMFLKSKVTVEVTKVSHNLGIVEKYIRNPLK